MNKLSKPFMWVGWKWTWEKSDFSHRVWGQGPHIKPPGIHPLNPAGITPRISQIPQNYRATFDIYHEILINIGMELLIIASLPAQIQLFISAGNCSLITHQVKLEAPEKSHLKMFMAQRDGRSPKFAFREGFLPNIQPKFPFFNWKNPHCVIPVQVQGNIPKEKAKTTTWIWGFIPLPACRGLNRAWKVSVLFHKGSRILVRIYSPEFIPPLPTLGVSIWLHQPGVRNLELGFW